LLDLLAISDLEIGAIGTIIESLAAEVVPPADPQVLELLDEGGQPELAALDTQTHTPDEPQTATNRPRGRSHDGHSSSGDTDDDPAADADGSNDC
jgi:hypothetical protein